VTRARILGAIDAMAETHYRFPGPALALHVVGSIRRVADVLRHAHHVLGGASVRRPRKRGDRCRDRSVEVGFGAGDDSRGERRRVRTVLGMQDHVDVHESRGIGARPFALQHPQEIRRMRKSGIGRNDIAVVAKVLVRGDDHRHLRGETSSLAQRRGA